MHVRRVQAHVLRELLSIHNPVLFLLSNAELSAVSSPEPLYGVRPAFLSVADQCNLIQSDSYVLNMSLWST